MGSREYRAIRAATILVGKMCVRATAADELFEFREGVPYFRGLRVHLRELAIGGRTFEIASLHDAAELLDHPEYAKPFLERDIAPYGLELWPVAVMLAERILTGEPGAGREVLDLGCGLGLTSMAATLAGWRVTAADHEPTSLRFAQSNAERNGIEVASFEYFDWNQPPPDRKFARVLAADVLYQRVDHVPILKCLSTVLDRDGLVMIADPKRGVADKFADLAREHGWQVEVQPGEAPNFFGPKAIDGRIFCLGR